MGRRFYLGLGILIGFLILGLLVSAGMVRLHQPIADTFAHAARSALEGAMEEGISLARQAQNRWQQYRMATASVADHTPMDEVEKLLAEMEVFAEARDSEHFAACCAQLARLVRAVADAHSPGLENIL